ncbi:MAG: hypothetical protein OSB00_12705 [Sphingomonas bacterium]|nr:hypothetical protein [Sphingomonas bacterium]
MAVTLLLLWSLMLAGADTPIGRTLYRGSVTAPARFINKTGRGHVLLTASLVALIAGLVWLIGDESVRLMAMGAPEIASWLVVIDAASLIDAAVAAVMVASSVRLDALKTRIARSVRRASRARRRATVPRPGRMTVANDDEEGAGWAVAA